MTTPVSRIGPNPSEITFVSSAPRPTPTPANVRFAEVLARNAGAIAKSAEAAMKSLPGSAMLALAIRGPGGTGHIAPGLLSARGGPAPAPGAASPEGPGGSPAASTGPGEPGIESSLVQAQEMNLYYLRIQEAMNAQNRTYSALSNVLKAQHDTVKNAISNIR